MKGVTIYTVVVDNPRRHDGLTDDIYRFRKRANADSFAKGRTHYGQPATVDVDEDVPRRLVDRWSFAG